MNSLSRFVSAILLICFSSSLFAHATIGTLDVRRALFETEAWQSELHALEEQYAEEQQTVAQLQEELQETFSSIEINEVTLTETELQRFREEAQLKQLRIQRIGERVQTSLQETQNNFLERYRTLLGDALNEVYEEGEFDFILNANSVIMSGFSLDVTPQVTAKLNELIAATP